MCLRVDRRAAGQLRAPSEPQQAAAAAAVVAAAAAIAAGAAGQRGHAPAATAQQGLGTRPQAGWLGAPVVHVAAQEAVEHSGACRPQSGRDVRPADQNRTRERGSWFARVCNAAQQRGRRARRMPPPAASGTLAAPQTVQRWLVPSRPHRSSRRAHRAAARGRPAAGQAEEEGGQEAPHGRPPPPRAQR